MGISFFHLTPPDGSVSHSGVCRMHSEMRMGTGQTDFRLPVRQTVDELEESSVAVFRGRKVTLAKTQRSLCIRDKGEATRWSKEGQRSEGTHRR